MFLKIVKSREDALEEGTLYEPKNDTPTRFNLFELNSVVGFLSIDSDLWVFRRFERLRLCNILSIQQRLLMLEHELEMQSTWDEMQKTWKKPRDPANLVSSIQQALNEYDIAVAALVRWKSYKVPEDHVVSHMMNWVHENGSTNGQPLLSTLDCKDGKDIASIAAAEKTWTHKFIDRHACLRSCFAKGERNNSDHQRTTLVYSEESVRKAEAVFLHFSFCVLLLCPVIALSYLHSPVWKFVLLGIFLLIASVLSVGFLNTPNKSGLALVAGYAAILVVFLSNNVGS